MKAFQTVNDLRSRQFFCTARISSYPHFYHSVQNLFSSWFFFLSKNTRVAPVLKKKGDEWMKFKVAVGPFSHNRDDGCRLSENPFAFVVISYTGLFEIIVRVLTTYHTRSPDATPCDFFLWAYVKDQVYVPPLPSSIPELKVRIRTAIETITADVRNELDYRVDVCRITKGAPVRYVQKLGVLFY